MRPAGWGHQSHDGQGGHTLTAAGLADNPQGLAGFQRKADPVHRLDDAGPSVEVGPQVTDFEERRLFQYTRLLTEFRPAATLGP